MGLGSRLLPAGQQRVTRPPYSFSGLIKIRGHGTPQCLRCRKRVIVCSAQPSSPEAWWDGLNRSNIQGPEPPAPPYEPKTQEEISKQRMGEKGYKLFESMKKQERQRVWDCMRRAARDRYQAGIMPPWFNPKWLDIEEAPMNTWWRQQGLSEYEFDTTWLGDGGDGGAGGGDGGKSGSGGKGGGWWREDDPYWSLRDWGDHPMRWWTWGFAGLLAVGGLFTFMQTGSAESVWAGFSVAAVLAVCAMGMSDIRDELQVGEAAIKGAWAACLLLAAKEYWWGWQHKERRRWLTNRQPHLELCGWSALAMCALYMWTGMSGLWEYALPTNPGEAFKMVDIARKHRVWDYWGYGDLGMR